MTAKWKHTQPYPSWPFTRVSPSELAKYIKQSSKPVQPALF